MEIDPHIAEEIKHLKRDIYYREKIKTHGRPYH